MIYQSYQVVKFALQNFFRNFWLSIATLTVIIITLLLVNVVIVINQIKAAALTGLEERVDISLDFTQYTTEAAVLEVKSDLQTDPRVRDVTIITPEDNLELFKQRYPEIGERVIPILDSNPLGYTLKVRATELYDYSSILTDIENESEYSDILDATHFNDFRTITSNASALSEKLNVIAVSLASIFFVIAVIIVFNTIRVSVYTHREEIAIMKLVGATNSFVRLPFVIEALIYSAVSLAILAFLIAAGLHIVQPLVDRFFTGFAEVRLTDYYAENAWKLLVIQFAAVVTVSTASTVIALRRYLRI